MDEQLCLSAPTEQVMEDQPLTKAGSKQYFEAFEPLAKAGSKSPVALLFQCCFVRNELLYILCHSKCLRQKCRGCLMQVCVTYSKSGRHVVSDANVFQVTHAEIKEQIDLVEAVTAKLGQELEMPNKYLLCASVLFFQKS